MTANSVFISYSGDRADRKQLTTALRERGINPWRDMESIPLGESAALEIGEALRSASGAIVWINQYAVTSDYIRNIEAPAIRQQWSERGILVAPVIDGFPGIGDGLAAFRKWTGFNIADSNGQQIDPQLRPELEAARIANAYVDAHLRRCHQSGSPPIVRAVTREDTAKHRDDATLNFDWRHRLSSGNASAEDLRDLFDSMRRSLSSLLAHFGPTEVEVCAKVNLPIALAIGHCLRRTTGAMPIMHAYGERWVPDVNVNSDLLKELSHPAGDARTTTSALEVSISNDVSTAVLETLRRNDRTYRQHMALRPAAGPGQTALTSNSAANTWARQIRDRLEALASEPGVDSVDLFFAGPVELAVLIGWWLNAAGTIIAQEYDRSTGAYVRMWTTPAT
jgi:hypothetical protein